MTSADANRKYFDNIGDSYDNKPWFTKMNQQVTDALRSRLDWVGIPFANISPDSSSNIPTATSDVRLLDYACGPGLMSRIYGPYVTIIQGIDISPNMVAIYNARARAANFPAAQVNAVVGDLFSKEEPNPRELSGPEYKNFDLATVGFGFHHFEDVTLAARRLKERLRPGGVLVINEFLEGGDYQADENGDLIEGSQGDHLGSIHHGEHDDHDPNRHGHGHAHAHHHHHHHQKDDDTAAKARNASIVIPSFTIDGIKKFFTEAGFVDVDVVSMEEKAYMEVAGKKLWRTILFAKGRRPVEEKSEL